MIGPHMDRAVTPDDQRQIAKDNGYTAMQTHWGNPRTLALNKDGYGLAKSTYASNDPFWVFHSAYCAVASPPADKEKATGDYLKLMLQHARRAHAHAVVVHVGGTKEHTAAQVQDRIRTFLLNQNFEGFFESFQPYGEWPICLLLENVAAAYPFNQSLFNIAEVARQFRQVGWCLDLAHANAAGIPHDQLLEVIDKHCPNVCHCNYPGSPFGSGRDRHGWRYRAEEFNKEHGLTQLQQDQWDEVVRLLHRQKVPLILEGSSTPGSYNEEVRFVRNLVTETATKSDGHEHYRSEDNQGG